MDKSEKKLLIVCDDSLFLGLISIGDIQRAIISQKELDRPVIEFMRKSITVTTVSDDLDAVKNKMRKERIESMPVIDADSRLVDVIEWDELFDESVDKRQPINIPVVVMAGGRGTRLLPLTNIIPKPLIPISNKTIIEEILQNFKDVGCEDFYVSVNYKGKTIEDYLSKQKEWLINYVYEDEPLGTAGALFLLKDKLKSTFFVTNCDTLIDVDLRDLLEYHRNNNNLITVVSAVKDFSIPYGIIKCEGEGGIIREIKEKPDLVYQINTGMYVLEPDVLGSIEKKEFLNITDLIVKMINENAKVGAFPIPAGSWVDMGNWDEYFKLINRYNNS